MAYDAGGGTDEHGEALFGGWLVIATSPTIERPLARHGGVDDLQPGLPPAPAIVVLDERGVVRWPSEGFIDPPADDPVFPGEEDQYTVIQAIEFAKSAL